MIWFRVIIAILILSLSGINFLEAKINVLALDFNQTSETDVLKNLSKECSGDIEVRSALDDEKLSGGPEERIIQLCEAGYAPDVIMISGHFASSWSGGRGRLTLVDLEKLSCDPRCNNFFSKVKIGFFLACNNLLGAEKTNETAENYVRRLMEEHQGDFDADTIIEAGIDMYETEGGNTNAFRLSNIFSNSKALLGFAGGAPLTSKENGMSDIGFKNVFEKFNQKTQSKNICEGLGKILENEKEKSLDPLVKLLGSWKEEMNKTEAVGQDAAYLCQQCQDSLKTENEEVPRTIICNLLSGDKERQSKAIQKAFSNPTWVNKLFTRIVQAMELTCNDEIPCAKLNITKEQRDILLGIARKKIELYPLLVHKWIPLKMMLYLSDKDNLIMSEYVEHFKKYLNDYIKNPKVINRDLFRQTIQEAPHVVIKQNADELFLHYKTTKDWHLKSDIHEIFVKTIGFYKNIFFHSESVLESEFSSSNKYLVTASADGISRVLEIKDGKLVALGGDKIKHAAGWLSSKISPDEKYIVTVSEDGTSKVLEIKDDKLVELGGDKIKQVGLFSSNISNNEKYIVTTSKDGTSKVFEIKDGKLVELGGDKIKHAAGRWFSSNISNNEKYLVTASDDGTSKVFEIKDGKLVELGGDKIKYTAGRLSTKISANEQYIVTASNDGISKVFEIKDGKLVELGGDKIQHTAGWLSTTISANDKYIVTASNDGTSKVFEIKDGKLVELGGDKIKQEGLLSSKISPNEKYRVTPAFDGTSQVFEIVKDGEKTKLVELGKDK
ncbi:MAG: hypothetical protein A2202_08685 [Bdellovibrionales bacterium RIFOXYA1_FULL_36_14]|nr:MAG: hypothetical protein A2202_08685 [Bdellovibrionales bacterium RIFOXYA1_FULL_36_14]